MTKQELKQAALEYLQKTAFGSTGAANVSAAGQSTSVKGLGNSPASSPARKPLGAGPKASTSRAGGFQQQAVKSAPTAMNAQRQVSAPITPKTTLSDGSTIGTGIPPPQAPPIAIPVEKKSATSNGVGAGTLNKAAALEFLLAAADTLHENKYANDPETDPQALAGAEANENDAVKIEPETADPEKERQKQILISRLGVDPQTAEGIMEDDDDLVNGDTQRSEKDS